MYRSSHCIFHELSNFCIFKNSPKWIWFPQSLQSCFSWSNNSNFWNFTFDKMFGISARENIDKRMVTETNAAETKVACNWSSEFIVVLRFQIGKGKPASKSILARVQQAEKPFWQGFTDLWPLLSLYLASSLQFVNLSQFEREIWGEQPNKWMLASLRVSV